MTRTATSSEATLFEGNDLEAFWRPLHSPAPEQWARAVHASAQGLPEAARSDTRLLSILHSILGEAQFGAQHWELSSARRAYYAVKPVLPRLVTRAMRRLQSGPNLRAFPLAWPIEDRYAQFLAEAISNLLVITERSSMDFIHFWPSEHAYALVLTHDIETEEGQQYAIEVAELDHRFGFRSCFNFVPRRYNVDRGLIAELRARGFEVGIHDFNHDGKLFANTRIFSERAGLINSFAAEIGARGFRAALTHRNPTWMQELGVDYDLSFFDTDPFEPIAGGTMSLWPFWIGRFLELPYTLVQDYTMTRLLKQPTPWLWLSKIDYIASRCGMALLISHPDYLRSRSDREIYTEFLGRMAERADFWHALPGEVFEWWSARRRAGAISDLNGAVTATIGHEGWGSVQRTPVARAPHTRSAPAAPPRHERRVAADGDAGAHGQGRELQ